MREMRSLFAVGLCFVFLFNFACGQRQESGEKAVGAKTHGGTLVVGISGDADSFNPIVSEELTSEEIRDLILLGLADINDKLDFEPELAESWEFSEDHLELTYRIAKNAVWADGTPITAEDVKFSYELYGDTAAASPRSDYVEFIEEITAVDDRTVKFIFSKAYPDQVLESSLEIVPKHILGKINRKDIRTADYGRNPLCSGPFKLTNWISQQQIELSPNETYFKGRPYLDRVVFKIVPDRTNLLVQLQTGEIDMMEDVPPIEAKRLKEQHPDIGVYPTSGRLYYFVGWNLKNPLFQSKNVRQALTTAINRQEIIDNLLYGFGKQCTGPIPPIIAWAHNPDIRPFPYDTQRAKQMLAQEGWTDTDGDGWLDKDGKTFEFSLKTNMDNQVRVDALVMIQDDLKDIGIKVTPRLLEWTVYVDEIFGGNYEACIAGWSARMSPDPTAVFHSNSTDQFNFVSYANPRVDELIERGRVEFDRQKAQEIWYEFQELVYDDQPYTFLFWIDRIVAIHKRFRDVNPAPISAFYQLESWWVAEGDRKH